jgi:hypothetical protein
VELLLRPLADAFLQVGVYVAVAVTGFDWLRARFGDRITGGLSGGRRWGPLAGALLGLTPGCGGAILLMPLYVQGRVSFGTVVAALVATMGDSSWVIIAGDPALALRLHLLLFAAGLGTGYAVEVWRARASGRSGVPAVPVAVSALPVPAVARAAGVAAPATPAPATPAPGARILTVVFWTTCLPAAVLSVAVLAGGPGVAGAPGGVDLSLLLGTAGCLAAAALFLAGGGRRPPDHPGRSGAVSFALRHGAGEAAFVTVWVAVAFLAWEAFSEASGFDGSQLVLLGVTGVLVGAVVGLIPGCAVHIVFTGLYLGGGLPLATLVANAVSQDGDALIPLAAMRPRSALAASVVTTVPAMLTGLGVLLLVGP